MTSDAPSAAHESELADPLLLQWLAALGLGVEYVRGEGNTLFLTADDGTETAVIDYAGGYGSLVLGHNHPGIVAAARSFLDAGTPTLAQGSRQPAASRVAAVLDGIVRREFGTDEPYFSVFSNSGAESVEVALKHAEFDRGLRIRAIHEEIAGHLDAAAAAVRAGEAKPPDAVFEALGIGAAAEPAPDTPHTPDDAGAPDNAADNDTSDTGGEWWVRAVLRENARRAARPPLLLTLEGSFHGKLIGSVQLTHNAAYRTPFEAMAPPARFIPFDRPEALAGVFERERGVLLDVVVENGEVGVRERGFPVFAAFVCEVILGEGGIRRVTPGAAAEIQRACAAADCPIVVDEIQSGMGRTGAFFASSHIGLRADYYTLAKGLGGGLAKTAVTLIRGGRYRPEFELVHTSTFAKDTFSSTIALRTLELLEADDGRAYRLAREGGERLTEVFDALRAAFPEVVKDVRGTGLMLGLELHDQSGSVMEAVRDAARSGTFGYLVAGYLLRVHRIRTFPTASAVNTLRFEPSVLLTEEEVRRLDIALRELCEVLREGDERAFIGG
ncbi:aspartate aminotransferase family protein [Streptomyces sp. NPDC058953]|uniref:aspartate aminotransferase family protein n=1 Tax=unclassified Streptomyces TaxID=2593676 RepID=UPI0036A0F8F7